MKSSPTNSGAVAAAGPLALFTVLLVPAPATEAAKTLSRDHTVDVHSTVPAIAGQTVELYVRERICRLA